MAKKVKGKPPVIPKGSRAGARKSLGVAESVFMDELFNADGDVFKALSRARGRRPEEIAEDVFSTLDEFFGEGGTALGGLEEAGDGGGKGIFTSGFGEKISETKVDPRRSVVTTGFPNDSGPDKSMLSFSARKDGKTIAEVATDGGEISFIKSKFAGSKEKALDRLLAEAAMSGVDVADESFSGQGAKAVTKRLAELKKNPDMIEEAVRSIRKTGKMGKIWQKIPIIGPGIAALAALAGSDEAKAEAVLDMLDPTGLLSPTTMGDSELTPERREQIMAKKVKGKNNSEKELFKRGLEDTAKARRKETIKRSQAIAGEGFVKAVEAQKAIPASAKRDQAASMLTDIMTAPNLDKRLELSRKLQSSLVANTMAWLEESGYDLQELGQLQLTDDMDEVADLYDAAASGDLQRMKQRYFQSQDKTNKRTERKDAGDFKIRRSDEMKKFDDWPGDRVDEVNLRPRSQIQRDVEEAAAKEGQREV